MTTTYIGQASAPINSLVPLAAIPNDEETMTDVSYPSLPEEEKRVFYQKYEMFKDWNREVAAQREAASRASTTGKAMGTDSAIWSDRLENEKPSDYVAKIPGKKQNSNPIRVLQKLNLSSPPLPPSAPEPTIRVSRPDFDSIPPSTPRDKLNLPTQFGSTGSRSDAYLASSTKLPLDMISDFDTKRPVSRGSSKLTTGRIASLLSLRTQAPKDSTQTLMEGKKRRPSTPARSGTHHTRGVRAIQTKEKSNHRPEWTTLTSLAQAPDSTLTNRDLAHPGPVMSSDGLPGGSRRNQDDGLGQSGLTPERPQNAVVAKRPMTRQVLSVNRGAYGKIASSSSPAGVERTHDAPARQARGSSVSQRTVRKSAETLSLLSKLSTGHEPQEMNKSSVGEAFLGVSDVTDQLAPKTLKPSTRGPMSLGSNVTEIRNTLPTQRAPPAIATLSRAGQPSIHRRHRSPSSADPPGRREPAVYPPNANERESDASVSDGSSPGSPDAYASARGIDAYTQPALPPPRHLAPPERTSNSRGHASPLLAPALQAKSYAEGHKVEKALQSKNDHSPSRSASFSAAAPRPTVDHSPPSHPTISLLTSPPPNQGQDTDHLSSEVPSGPRGRLRVSLAWFRDGARRERSRRDTASEVSSLPPPVPPKDPASSSSHMRNSLKFRSEMRPEMEKQRNHWTARPQKSFIHMPDQFSPPIDPRVNKLGLPPTAYTYSQTHVSGLPVLGAPILPLVTAQNLSVPHPILSRYAYPQPQPWGRGQSPYLSHPSGMHPSLFAPQAQVPPSPPRAASIESPTSCGSPPPSPILDLKSANFPIGDSRELPYKQPNPNGTPWYTNGGHPGAPLRQGNGFIGRLFGSRGRRDGPKLMQNEMTSVRRWRRDVSPFRPPPKAVMSMLESEPGTPIGNYHRPRRDPLFPTLIRRSNRRQNAPGPPLAKPSSDWNQATKSRTVRRDDLAAIHREREKEERRRMKMERRNRRLDLRAEDRPRFPRRHGDIEPPRRTLIDKSPWSTLKIGKTASNRRPAGFGPMSPSRPEGRNSKSNNLDVDRGMLGGWAEDLRRYFRRGGTQCPRDNNNYPRSLQPQAGGQISGRSNERKGERDPSPRSPARKWGDRAKRPQRRQVADRK